MTWIPWIRIEPEDSSNEEVQKLYKKARKPLTGKLSDLTQLTSLSPEMSSQLHGLGVAVYRDAGSLSLREKEVAALSQRQEVDVDRVRPFGLRGAGQVMACRFVFSAVKRSQSASEQQCWREPRGVIQRDRHVGRVSLRVCWSIRRRWRGLRR